MNAVVNDARLKWRNGESLVAGQLLFDALPEREIADWSLSILELAIKWIPAPTVVLRLARDARHPSFFSPTPKQHFEAIRKLTLKLDRLKSRSPSQECTLNLCYLAENVAKVLGNLKSLGAEADFDVDAGWWVVHCLHGCAQCVDSLEFFNECEMLLFGEGQGK